jgi:hypothetical protein
MIDLPKPIKRQLRELSTQAYERELSHALDKLSTQFDDWQAGKIGPWELTEVIHKFHDGQARDLFKLYESAPDLRPVIARAVAEGILTQEDVPGSVWPYIESVVEFYQQESGKQPNKQV